MTNYYPKVLLNYTPICLLHFLDLQGKEVTYQLVHLPVSRKTTFLASLVMKHLNDTIKTGKEFQFPLSERKSSTQDPVSLPTIDLYSVP